MNVFKLTYKRINDACYRSPSSWNYGVVKLACCSLDTLSQSELEAIRDDLILVSCQGCAADDEPLHHLQHLRQRIEERRPLVYAEHLDF